MKTALAPSEIHACQRCGVVRRVNQRRSPRLCRDCKRQEVPVSPTPAWMNEGLCRHLDPEWWFPQSSKEYDDTPALEVCWQCPVRVQCLEHALAADERFGIWGGYTTLERQRIAASRRAS